MPELSCHNQLSGVSAYVTCTTARNTRNTQNTRVQDRTTPIGSRRDGTTATRGKTRLCQLPPTAGLESPGVRGPRGRSQGTGTPARARAVAGGPGGRGRRRRSRTKIAESQWHGTGFETKALLVKALKCATKRLHAFHDFTIGFRFGRFSVMVINGWDLGSACPLRGRPQTPPALPQCQT